MVNTPKDMKNRRCITGCGGRYRELDKFDEWDGTVTCDWCGDQVNRWIHKAGSNPFENEAK